MNQNTTINLQANTPLEILEDAQASPIENVLIRQSPKERYRLALASNLFFYDEAQNAAIDALEAIWQDAVQRFDSQKRGFRALKMGKRKASPKGLYMWGGVGRGKSWLMDQFFESLPFRRKLRMHFHHFMHRVHRDLNSLQGQRDPLIKVADNIFSDGVVICFDEFYVSNVTDAMILGELFGLLFARGITLVATSNIHPDGLYKDGIHRDRFLPAIENLKQYCGIINVDAGVDYRLRVLKQADLFKSPLSEQSNEWLESRFLALTNNREYHTASIIVNHREIAVNANLEDVLWCDFNEMCLKPRSAADYIEIANTFGTVLLGNIPLLNDQISEATRRFIYFVDEMYDRGVVLVITSQAPILALYQGEKLAFEIKRTRSRLLEMQSDTYLKQAHHVEE